MPSKNKYAYRSKISEAKFRQLVRLFALDLDAEQIAVLTNLNRNTVNRYLRGIRERMAEQSERQSPFRGVVEADESYFGPRRIPGIRGRGARGKTIVFGILKRGDCVYTEIVPNVSRATLRAVLHARVDKDSEINTDALASYDGLVDLGYSKHYRVKHGDDEFVRGDQHINGIESFWGYAKSRLTRFRGIHKSTFYLHLKECEYRFNHRNKDLYQVLLKLLRQRPLF